MHQTKRSALRQSFIPTLFLLTVLSVTTVYEFAGADELRGEDYITGFSLSDFNGVGHIDSMEEDRMVIDDCSRRLSSGISYYKPGPVKISASAFSVGSRVGYVEDRNGQIRSLWLLPAKSRSK
ncbi:MAG: hypothetical protein LJE96_10490 [Deltaproteobacteria bacterium]|jgi:hypothetical protein|nr:hypothetical protein [Deltaproteobacteria bacterium]